VTLTDLKAALSIAALAFEGDLPASIFHLQLIAQNITDWSAKAQVIAVFHTSAGHVMLDAQRRPHIVDRQPLQGTPSGSHETRLAGRALRGHGDCPPLGQ
jgi:hypothetical protein